MKNIKIFEPWIFLFFGIFHLHRIWGLLDRKSYADFWISILEHKNWFYFLLIGLLAALCILGIQTFLKNLFHNQHNYWWRWIYIFGGGYLLFDLFAILTGWGPWHDLILNMYDITAPWWNLLWSLFILMGGAVFILGIKLLIDRHHSC